MSPAAVVDVLALTLLQLAFGLLVFNLLTPGRHLGGGFFALHGVLAVAAVALAFAASRGQGLLLAPAPMPIAPRSLFWVFAASLALHTLLARVDAVGWARTALLPGLLAGGALLASRAYAAPLAGRGLGSAWLACGLVLGALLFGAVVWAMNLGHWYLVSRELPFQLLARASEAYGALALVRCLFAIGALGLLAWPSVGEAGYAFANLVDPLRDGLFFWSRVLWGLLAPLALAPFVIRTARMKSNQAATGLLYVALVFVMIGELLATYLTLRSGLPV